MIQSPIKGESLKADWAKAVTEGVNSLAPVSGGRRGLVTQTPSGTGFSASKEVRLRQESRPMPFTVAWGRGNEHSSIQSSASAEAVDPDFMFYLPSDSLVYNNTAVEFDGEESAVGGGWMYWDSLELKTGSIWCVIDTTASTATMVTTLPNDLAGKIYFAVATTEKLTAGTNDYPKITQLVYGQVMLSSPGSSIPRIYEPQFTDGIIQSVGEGAWGVARETYIDTEPDINNLGSVGQDEVTIYIHIHHEASADPSAEIVSSAVANDDSNTYLPLYRVKGGKIVMDYRGEPPRAQVYE